MSYTAVALKFEKAGDIDIKSIWSIYETKEACAVQHSPIKLQQVQVQRGRVKSLPTFKKWMIKQLNDCKCLAISDVAVINYNKVFFCKLFACLSKMIIYHINQDNLTHNTTLSLPNAPFGISILTGTDIAVITKPSAYSLQCIDTKHLKLDKSIEVGNGWYGITTSEEFLVAGKSDEIKD